MIMSRNTSINCGPFKIPTKFNNLFFDYSTGSSSLSTVSFIALLKISSCDYLIILNLINAILQSKSLLQY